ncbi:MAG: cell division protein FtsA [Bacillota bacterium]|nr:cell division protein FtsA [Bacillota bacterium]
MSDIIVGIDIGTSKVCTVIGQLGRADELVIIGEGMDSCCGIKKGVIVDIESTARAVKNSVEQAEAKADIKIGSAYVNIIGMHVSVLNYRSEINRSGEENEISQRDIDKVLHNVRDIELPEDRQLIDIIPRQYIIDGYDEIVDPIGMLGVKMEVDADVIAAKITSAQNIIKSLEKAGLKIDGLVVESFATAEMALTQEEKDIGVILVDVGGGVTDISVYKNNRLLFYDSIPVGGDHITNDISIGLKISHNDAEKIKRQFELALTSLIKNDQDILVNEINENKKKAVKVSEVVEIIECRVHEILYLCNELLCKSGIRESLPAGIVLTGGGISHIDGGKQLASEVFELPVRIATPKLNGITKSEFMTAAGIVRFANNNKKGTSLINEIKNKKQVQKNNENGVFKKLSALFKKLS